MASANVQSSADAGLETAIDLLNKGYREQADEVQQLEEKLANLQINYKNEKTEKRNLAEKIKNLKKYIKSEGEKQELNRREHKDQMNCQRKLMFKQLRDMEDKLENVIIWKEKASTTERKRKCKQLRESVQDKKQEVKNLKKKLKEERKTRENLERECAFMEKQIAEMTGNLKKFVGEEEGGPNGKLTSFVTGLNLAVAPAVYIATSLFPVEEQQTKKCVQKPQNSPVSDTSFAVNCPVKCVPGSSKPAAEFQLPELPKVISSSITTAKWLLETKDHALDKVKEQQQKVIFCICGLQFLCKDNLAAHVQYFALGCKFPCDVCSETFDSIALVNDHWRYNHPKEEVPHKDKPGCGFCGVIFANMEELMQHRLSGGGKGKRASSRPIYCPMLVLE